ncbi:hypothetical protein GWK47_037724 [Chionoecetes opilio]|uniref:Uncharacterized protein n=1 Tax=Chionoecetes opilio TaxID=41210 RepID=A0A8J4YG51_CHIOP|nr:hypothetical protein GWK47_037724 [Chionoecetes opilio]
MPSMPRITIKPRGFAVVTHTQTSVEAPPLSWRCTTPVPSHCHFSPLTVTMSTAPFVHAWQHETWTILREHPVSTNTRRRTPSTLTIAHGNASLTDRHERRLALTPPLHARFPNTLMQCGLNHHIGSTLLVAVCGHELVGELNSLWRDD